MRYVQAVLLFAIVWLLWSGVYSPLVLFFGVVSCTLVLLVARRTGFFDVDVYAMHLVPRLPKFWMWLLREIVKSNVAVAKIILDPRLPIKPTIVSVDASHLLPATQATLANAITLTPGTVSVDIDRGVIEVHCLTSDAADSLRNGEMLRRVTMLSKE